MNYQELQTAFLKIRAEQAADFGKQEQTQIDKEASAVIFEAGRSAISNVETGDARVYMQAVSLGTGMGKTTSACAFLAAAFLTDPDFSGAFVVQTARMGEEVKQLLDERLGRECAYLWTSYHDKNSRIAPARIVEALGKLPARQTTKDKLSLERLIIITHETLKNEAKYGHEYGVTTYHGRPRNVVFIDESPDVLDVYTVTPAELQFLHDKCHAREELRFALPTIARVVARMSAVMQFEGQAYAAASLISHAEFEALKKIGGDELWALTDNGLSIDLRREEEHAYRNAIMFLKSAACGNVFYSKKDGAFFSYLLHLSKSYPGYVLLDATSDLEGLVKLDTGIRSVAVPTTTYENLEIFSLDLPKRLNHKSDVAKSRALGCSYAEFIKNAVSSNACAGDEVLVVLPKFLIEQDLIRAADDPDHPDLWSGIRVNTQHWGAGVGSNKFRHKTHVFLFGDHVLPRSVTIARAHAWSGAALNNEVLEEAVSRRTIGARYRPKGIYSGCHDGFILRWSKQLAMRGNARHIDGEGKAAAMKLFTTMSRELLMETYSTIFPDAPLPKPAKEIDGLVRDEVKGRKGLESLLFRGTQAYYSADEIEAVTSISTSRLGREYLALESRVKAVGWELCSAKVLGKPGRSKYLVNWNRIPGRLQAVDLAKLH